MAFSITFDCRRRVIVALMEAWLLRKQNNVLKAEATTGLYIKQGEGERRTTMKPHELLPGRARYITRSARWKPVQTSPPIDSP